MNSWFARPSWMISRAIALASEMSLPTSRPSHRSAHSPDPVRRGSTATRRAPLRTPRSRWWKKIGCVSRAFEPHRMMRSVSSTSRYDEVPPPAPNTVARPATLGACQVRLQLSTLLLPMTTRVNFCAMKFISFVVLEQLNMPNPFGPRRLAASNPAAARESASSHEAGRRLPPSLTSGWIRRSRPSPMAVGRYEIADQLQPKPQLVLRLRVGQAYVALPRRSERSAGKDRNARLCEQPVGQLPLIETGPLDVWECVERPLGLRAANAGYRVQAVDHEVTSVLEHFHHPVHCMLRFRSAQRLDGRHLCEAGGARRRVDHQLVQLFRQRLRSDRVTQTPTRHRIGLRKPVHEHRSLAHSGL